MQEPFKIMICGEGGQGAQSMAKVIAKAGFEQGLKSTYVPYFSTEKRGGVSIAFAQVGEEAPPYPRFSKADLWVALSQRSIGRIKEFLQPSTKVIVNSFLVRDLSELKDYEVHEINAGKIAIEEMKSSRVFNVIIMGAMVKLIPKLSEEGFKHAMKKTFEKHYKKHPELEELNNKAFDRGFELA